MSQPSAPPRQQPDTAELVREWWPEIAMAGGVLLIALTTVTSAGQNLSALAYNQNIVLVAGMPAATAMFRRAPGGALVLWWVIGFFQLAYGIDILAIELAVGVVAYGTARYGSTAVLWCSGLSIPLAAVAAAAMAAQGHLSYNDPLLGQIADLTVGPVRASITLLLAGTLPLVVPWLVGLVLRARARTLESEAATVQAREQMAAAEEVARLRADQARLARDVHDVVGHSLAVVLAQAESAQFLPDDDTERIRATFTAIATSARESLRDVRQVLASTRDDQPAAVPQSGLAGLIEGVRAAGYVVEESVEGVPRPLPPELDVVVFRVVQEMLTNALRHGERSLPVVLEQHWQGDLRIETRNTVGPPSSLGEGQGLLGMRRRVEAVGGRLDVRRRLDGDHETFTCTAWIPTHAAELR